ncbi:MAG: hypothetical protein VX086_03000 [Pseudomonadota bacterium]|nr:hypothetical protein [Pseudomonadota bacterium]|tara:strand:+ start:78 stop:233 length:156 start_codon:yes stop_codon:yes gene_type:complete
MISWIGLWVFVFSSATAIAIFLDKEKLRENITALIFLIIIAIFAGLAVIFR